MYILIISIILILILIGVNSYYMYVYAEKIRRGRTITVRSDGHVCTDPLGSLPVIPRELCDTGLGSTVLCYSPPDASDINFAISKFPRYYRSVCIELCVNATLNGNCEEQNALFDQCISILEPQEGCVNTAKPLGRLEGTSDIYYADIILPKGN